MQKTMDELSFPHVPHHQHLFYTAKRNANANIATGIGADMDRFELFMRIRVIRNYQSGHPLHPTLQGITRSK